MAQVADPCAASWPRSGQSPQEGEPPLSRGPGLEGPQRLRHGGSARTAASAAPIRERAARCDSSRLRRGQGRGGRQFSAGEDARAGAAEPYLLPVWTDVPPVTGMVIGRSWPFVMTTVAGTFPASHSWATGIWTLRCTSSLTNGTMICTMVSVSR